MVVTEQGVEKIISEVLEDDDLDVYWTLSKATAESVAKMMSYWYGRGHEDGYEEGIEEATPDDDDLKGEPVPWEDLG